MNEKNKKICIGVGVSIILLLAGFGTGYFVCNHNWSKLSTESVAKLKGDLDSANKSLDSANKSLDSANNRIAELESSINGAISSAEQNNKYIADAQKSIVSSTGTADELENLIGEYFSLVGKLQKNNRELEDRLESSIGENAGEQ